eukprot:306661-Chlamydomonas_euryale.AAC.4
MLPSRALAHGRVLWLSRTNRPAGAARVRCTSMKRLLKIYMCASTRSQTHACKDMLTRACMPMLTDACMQGYVCEHMHACAHAYAHRRMNACMHALSHKCMRDQRRARERKWKLTQCKRFAGAIGRSNLDIEGRAAKRELQEAEAARKKASWVAKQVALFWGKANRVKSTKLAVALEAKKKEVLDKNLDLILGQTEKYSKMLAANLQVVEEEGGASGSRGASAPPGLPTPLSLQPAPSSKKVVRFKEEGADGGMTPSETAPAYVDTDADEQATGDKEENEEDQEQEQEEESFAGLLKRPREGEAEGVEEEADGGSGGTGQRAAKRARGDALAASMASPLQQPPADDEDEYDRGGSDSADDERTLEEEAALEAKDRAAARKQEEEELAGLDEEADMPIEELMKRYG